MKELGLKLKEWWQGLALREKQAVAIGGFVVMVFILYQGIWSPSLQFIAKIRARISSDQKLLVWMQAADKKIRDAKGETNETKSAVSPMVLLSQIKKQINQSGLENFLIQLKQAGNETIEVDFKKIEFNALITWLNFVMKEQNVSLTKISLTASDKPGFVNANINLKQFA